MKNVKAADILKIAAIIIFLAVIGWIVPTVFGENLKEVIEQAGIFGPLLFIIYTILSHIFAPISGSPALVVSFIVFGVSQTIFYAYVASLISAVINFYIARVYGRNLVIRFVGKHTLKEIDEFAAAFGDVVLIFGRIFGFPIFEVISYAAGLTNMSFIRYMIITTVCSILPNVFYAFLFKQFDFTEPKNILIWFGLTFVIGVIFTVIMKRYVRQSKKSKKAGQKK